MKDATNNFAWKKKFCKLVCSRTYHCVQMVDDLSVQTLAFNFAFRTFVHKFSAHVLIKSVNGFTSFVKHYLDTYLAPNFCTHFEDDTAA